MTNKASNPDTDSLSRLVQLRQRELDTRQSELASRQALRERHQRNVDQLEQLWRNSTSGVQLAPALSLNCANYKQTVLQLASVHREDLVRHEATVDMARQAVVQASRRHGAVEQALERRRQVQLREEGLREQKSQDELASRMAHPRSAFGASPSRGQPQQPGKAGSAGFSPEPSQFHAPWTSQRATDQ